MSTVTVTFDALEAMRTASALGREVRRFDRLAARLRDAGVDPDDGDLNVVRIAGAEARRALAKVETALYPPLATESEARAMWGDR